MSHPFSQLNGEVDQERLAVALKRVTKDSQRRVPWRPRGLAGGLSSPEILGLGISG